MKNFKLLYRESFKVLHGASLYTNDNETSKFFVSDHKVIEVYDALTRKRLHYFDLSESQYEIDCESLEIVGMQFMYGEEQLCVALKHGEIVLCNTTDQSVESGGILDCKLSGMFWSPDQEIVIFTTDRDSAVLMTHDLDPILEIEIKSDKFGDGSFVNVGWGSKETQFQGSVGKFNPAANNDIEKSNCLRDDNLTKVAWRGDGQYFSISSRTESGQRIIKIWNREAELQYTGEELVGLESSLTWKPAGALIASTQRKAHRHDVVFFELNGLQHGEFTLLFEKHQVEVTHLAWNSDSTVLLVIAKELDMAKTSKSYLQLWYCTNYHWTLKQSVEYVEDIAHASWDFDDSLTLHVLTLNGQCHCYKWCSEISSSEEPVCLSRKEEACTDPSYVAVVDGNILKITPFKHMSVPPPMCAYQLEMKHPVNDVCFSSCPTTNSNVAVLNNQGQLLIFDHGENEKTEEAILKMVCAGGKGFSANISSLSLRSVFCFDKSNVQFEWQTIRHLLWIDETTIIAAASSSNVDHILICSLNNKNVQCDKILVTDGFVVEMNAFFSDTWHVVYQTNLGHIFHFSSNDDSPNCTSLYFRNPIILGNMCQKMRTCLFCDTQTGVVDIGILSLSPQRQLYLNETLINSECTSFTVHSGFVLLTTSSHKLVAISRNVSLSELQKLYSKTTKSVSNTLEVTEIPRSVERGSSIVTVTPQDTKVILQMPRGNLEMVHPRALVLAVLKQTLNKSEYQKAFIIMRKHRINMNLLYDHNPAKFCSEVGDFVSSLDSADHLNIFLSDLREEDVTKTLYSQFYSGATAGTVSLLATNTSKIDAICDIVLSILSQRDDNKYFLSMLTAHVRKSTPEIDAALTKVKALKSSLDPGSKLVSRALQHLHVMVDARILYKEALATHDLTLALMVAQVSNDDPKEYLPFLNSLQDMEENYRNYSIDMFLKKYSSALGYLAKCPEQFEECLNLIKSQQLYKEGLAAFGRFTSQYKEVCKIYADHLASEQKYNEAGIILMRCELRKRALKCFTESGNWQLALNCASSIQYTTAEYVAVARAIADRLEVKNNFVEAAAVLSREAQDDEAAISVLVKGHKWADALRLIRTSKQEELADSLVIPAMCDLMNSFVSNFKSYREQFDRHYTRLLKVREIKKEQHLMAMMGGDGEGDLDSDIASDFGSTITSSSQGSNSSRSSGRSAKTRRKHERSKFSLREGSRFEEEGLLQALQNIVKHALASKEDVNDLILNAALFYLDKEASALQNLFQSTMELFSKFCPRIWTLPDPDEVGTGPQSTVNSILATRSSVVRETMKLSDLELFLPPKIDAKSRVGMHLYAT